MKKKSRNAAVAPNNSRPLNLTAKTTLRHESRWSASVVLVTPIDCGRSTATSHWRPTHLNRNALDEGANHGASTISQQVVKNVYLWQGRSWLRKALEALLTPAVELVWPKRRIIEVYLNVAEFDEGVFGVEAAARHYFGTSAADLSATQAARLAAILPNPKGRSAANPSDFVRRRSAQIVDGAATIRADGRSACFEG